MSRKPPGSLVRRILAMRRGHDTIRQPLTYTVHCLVRRGAVSGARWFASTRLGTFGNRAKPDLAALWNAFAAPRFFERKPMISKFPFASQERP